MSEALLNEIIEKNRCLQDGDIIQTYANYISNQKEMEASIFIYERLHCEIKKASNSLEIIKKLLIDDLGENDEKQYGLTRIYWQVQNRNTFDSNKFKSAYPNLYEDFKTEKEVKILKVGDIKWFTKNYNKQELNYRIKK